MKYCVLFGYLKNNIHIVVMVIASLLMAAYQGWAFRFMGGVDAIAYLDAADAIIKGEWEILFGGVWSPLYPMIVAIFLKLISPSPFWEFLVLKVVNFIIFSFALTSFVFFLNNVTNYCCGTKFIFNRKYVKNTKIKSLWWLFSYSAFLWATLLVTPIYLSTPDLLMTGLLLLSFTLAIKILQNENILYTSILLGLSLGLSYLAKAIMFPISLILIASLIIECKRIRIQIFYGLLTAVIFIVVVSPYIFILSQHQGKVTYSEAGRFNYLWSVGGLPKRHWQGGPAEEGIAENPT